MLCDIVVSTLIGFFFQYEGYFSLEGEINVELKQKNEWNLTKKNRRITLRVSNNKCYFLRHFSPCSSTFKSIIFTDHECRTEEYMDQVIL